MTFSEFFSDRLRYIIFQAVFVMISALFLLLTGTQTGIVLLLFLIWLLLFLLIQMMDFLRCRAKLLELASILDGLNKKYLFTECIPKGQTIYERKFTELFRQAGMSMIGAVSDAEAAKREYREYVESFVHEIKTPITAANLICRMTDADTRRKLMQELSQIEAQIERVLFYARAEHPEKDFLISQHSLSELVAQAISQHRTLLIQSNVRVETKDLEQMVFTDSKWTVFMLGQLLQNAARYRSTHPVICISARQLKGQVELTVKDNGIGIPSHELSRVFERGFTGSNGRALGGSTGIGLYLCRKISSLLEINLQINSTEDVGTSLTLTFWTRENLTKM